MTLQDSCAEWDLRETKEENKELTTRLHACEDALISMVQQYCQYDDAGTSYTHDFMSAGEEAFEYLIEHGFANKNRIYQKGGEMTTFKKGDKVRYKFYGNGKVIAVDAADTDDPTYLVQFKHKHPDLHDGDGRGKDDRCFYFFSKCGMSKSDGCEVLTLIPSKWTRVEDGLPEDFREVRVKLRGGEKRYGWKTTDGRWFVSPIGTKLGEFEPGVFDYHTDVISWRPLDPAIAPKVDANNDAEPVQEAVVPYHYGGVFPEPTVQDAVIVGQRHITEPGSYSGSQSTHWEGCEAVHPRCKIIKLEKALRAERMDSYDRAAEIGNLKAEINRLEVEFERVVRRQFLSQPAEAQTDEIEQLKAQNTLLSAYADKLAAGLPEGMLPKDIENMRTACCEFQDQVNDQAEEICSLHEKNMLLRANVATLIEAWDAVDHIRNGLTEANTRLTVENIRLAKRLALHGLTEKPTDDE